MKKFKKIIFLACFVMLIAVMAIAISAAAPESKSIEFDKNLAIKCPKLYNYLSTIKAGRLPHIKIWRKFYYKNDYGVHNFFRKRKYCFFRLTYILPFLIAKLIILV